VLHVYHTPQQRAVGAGRTLDPDWMKGRLGSWENELVVASQLPTGHVAAYSMPLVGGAFLWGGKEYLGRQGVPLSGPSDLAFVGSVLPDLGALRVLSLSSAAGRPLP
jgi:hypothetical protein